ncbi:MAG: hypothetical protein SOW25_03305 [Helicobacter sp.]|nr:hypothetical protein [Helicobacteraceae bacterium]MDY3113339.1 hypothetical protein [Helicobacter sp.]
MHKEIKKFLNNSHLLTLSVLDSSDLNSLEVYSANCYYVFYEECLSLIFKSEAASKHIQLAEVNPLVGVSVAKDSSHLADIEGVQIKAEFKKAKEAEIKAYYKRFPFARLGGGEIFSLEIYFAKYTNNKLLLKEKLTYVKD